MRKGDGEWRKKLYILLYIILILVSTRVYAKKESFEIEAGLINNYFNLKDFNRYLKARSNYLDDEVIPTVKRSLYNCKVDQSDFSKPNSSLGYFIQGRYSLADDIVFGGGLEFSDLESKYKLGDYYQDSYYLSLIGLTTLVAYRLPLKKGELDIQFGAASYWTELKQEEIFNVNSDIRDYNSATYNGHSLGAKLGTRLKIFISENLAFNMEINYQHLKFESLEDYSKEEFYSIYDQSMEAESFNFSGLEIKDSLVIKF